MHIPSIRIVDLSLIIPSSSRTLTVTTVLVIDLANARNRESKNRKPSAWAVKNTITRVPIDSGIATMIEILHTDKLGNRKFCPNNEK